MVVLWPKIVTSRLNNKIYLCFVENIYIYHPFSMLAYGGMDQIWLIVGCSGEYFEHGNRP
jgi:hypothetical protein